MRANSSWGRGPLRFHVIVIAVMWSAMAAAADLSTIERSIAREPVYTGMPQYVLLVFGREAAHCVWIVQDGRVLYVDRNANGNLTDDGPPVAAKIVAFTDWIEFEVGSLHEGPLEHERVIISIQKVSGHKPSLEKLKAQSPDAFWFGVSMLIESDRIGGGLIAKRFNQGTAGVDENGVLQFSDKAATAPILHFNGPLRIQSAPWDWKNELTPQRTRTLMAVLGTPGIGPGATVVSSYDGLIPEGAYPRLTCVFPAAAGQEPLRTSYDLKQRCCSAQLYTEFAAPAGLTVGTAEGTFEMIGWPTEEVASTKLSVPISATPSIPEEPVSKRLKATLVHTPRTGIIYKVQFSPDDRQVMGYSMIAHAVDVWDVDTAESIVHMEIGKGYDTLLLESVPSPDWQTLYSITRRRKATPLTENGQAMIRWEMEGAIHEWDLATGERRQSTITDPPASILTMSIAPDGSSLLLGTERSGLSKNNERKGELCLFDTRSKTLRPVAGRYHLTAEYSPDSTQLLVMAMKTEWHAGELHVLSASTGEVMAKGSVAGEFAVLGEAHFSPDGRQIAATFVDYPTPAEMMRLRIVLFDASTGAIQATREIEPGHASPYQLRYSPDGKSLSLIWRTGSNYDQGKFALLNAADGSIRWSRPLKEKEYVTSAMFRNDSQLLGLATQVIPEKKIDPDPLDVPQARIHLIDPGTGDVRETLIAPRGSVNDSKFSPDGRTLATGSTGAVHLWDVSGLE